MDLSAFLGKLTQYFLILIDHESLGFCDGLNFIFELFDSLDVAGFSFFVLVDQIRLICLILNMEVALFWLVGVILFFVVGCTFFSRSMIILFFSLGMECSCPEIDVVISSTCGWIHNEVHYALLYTNVAYLLVIMCGWRRILFLIIYKALSAFSKSWLGLLLSASINVQRKWLLFMQHLHLICFKNILVSVRTAFFQGVFVDWDDALFCILLKLLDNLFILGIELFSDAFVVFADVFSFGVIWIWPARLVKWFIGLVKFVRLWFIQAWGFNTGMPKNYFGLLNFHGVIFFFELNGVCADIVSWFLLINRLPKS